MKKLASILSFFTVAAIVLAACTKVDPLPYYNDGSKVTVSANRTTLTPTPADSLNNIVTFTWTSPNYASDPNTYKYILEVDSATRNFSRPFRKEVSGKMEASITGKELNAYLLEYGFRTGSPVTLEARIVSSYANNNERLMSNPVRLTVTPYTDPSTLTSTATTVTGTLATAAQTATTLNWTRSFNGYNGTITYSIQYDSVGKNFASPQEIPVGDNLLTKALSQGDMNTTALNEGVAAGSQGRIEYRVKAVTAQGATAFSNAVAITINTYQPLVRLYMPGGYQVAGGYGSEDWKPETAPEFIRDTRPEALNKLYYMYIYLPAGAQFKITQGRSWDLNFGGTGGNLSQNGDNLSVSTAGWYRISVDLGNMKYDIREGRMGFVGGATGAGWTPSNVFPNYALGAAATNLFVGLTDFTTGGWKLIDHNDWNNGDITATNVRSYGSNGPSESPLVVNGPNMPDITTAGRYRVIWDGRDVNNVKYEMSPANEMRVVGNGIEGVAEWNPGASPQMTYSGNGVWTIKLDLKANAEIKFLAGNDWGAFDYEDASGGSQALGTPRRLQWSGGPNFKTPTTAGNYTITLNEHTQTVTIN